MGNDLGQSGVSLAAGLAAIVVLMGVTMLWAVRHRHLSVVDTLWGLGFVVVAVVVAVAVPGVDGDPLARWLLLVLPGVWGLRLAWHLHRRNSGKPEDPRYVDLVERSGGEAETSHARPPIQEKAPPTPCRNRAPSSSTMVSANANTSPAAAINPRPTRTVGRTPARAAKSAPGKVPSSVPAA